MANPISYDQILAAFHWAGINYREYPGARDRCRCHDGSHSAGGPTVRPFSPISTLVHITAGNLGTRTVETYIRDIINGDPNIPFKAQFVVAPDGVVWINGVGRANHDGSMSQNAYNALVGRYFSLTNYDDRRGSGLTGNTYAYGIENINAGPPNAAQRDASVRICAAIAHAYGWTGREVAGHGEVASDRSFADPGMNMGEFRSDVMAMVNGGTPPPVVKEEDDLTPEEHGTLQVIANILSTGRLDGDRKAWPYAFTPIEATLSQVQSANTALSAKIDGLAAAIKSIGDGKVDTDAIIAAVDEAVSRSIAESVQVTGTLTVEPRQ